MAGEARAGRVRGTDAAGDLWAALEEGFREAADRTAGAVFTVPALDDGAEVTFAGNALAARWGAALVPGPVPAVSLRVRAWDSETSGVPAPTLPGGIESGPAAARPDRVETWLGPRFRATVVPEYGWALAWDGERREALTWAASPGAVPPWEIAAPFRSAWAWWAEGHGAVLAHGAVVGDGGGAALVTGISGSGKSTTSLACARAGMMFAGDDHVLLRESEGRVIAGGVFASAKLNLPHLRAAMPLLESLAAPPDSRYEKSVMVLGGEMRAQFAAVLPVVAIVLPHVAADGQVALRPAGPGAALRALGPSSVLQIPGCGPPTFARLAGIAGRLPAYALEVGPDLGAVVAAVGQAIAAGRAK